MTPTNRVVSSVARDGIRIPAGKVEITFDDGRKSLFGAQTPITAQRPTESDSQPLQTRVRELEAEAAELLKEVQDLHAQRALAPGLECKCEWCSREAQGPEAHNGHRAGRREWTLQVCPVCGAQENDPPSDCEYCEQGGQLQPITVVAAE